MEITLKMGGLYGPQQGRGRMFMEQVTGVMCSVYRSTNVYRGSQAHVCVNTRVSKALGS